MIKINNEKCIGCGACVSVCPKNCLSMEYDSEGFLYPFLNNSDCIECGACERVCAAEIKTEHIEILHTYAMKNKDEAIRRDSSSGGVFYELAKFVIENGGVVFGAAFDKDWNVCHVKCSEILELDKLRKSKYSQSDTNGIYEKVKNSLNEGKLVLFSGTPCQCNGLSLFLGNGYDSLIMVDFICHGVPSPKAWQKYLKFASRGKTISNVNFREKSDGWQNFNMCINFYDDTYLKMPFYENSYMNLFLGDYILRPSCYDCQSKFPNKASDITIGDLWGADNIVLDNDDKGITLVAINSIAGEKLLENVKSNFEFEAINFNDAVKYNENAVSSVSAPKNRNKVIKLIFKENADFDKLANKITKNNTLFNKIKLSAKIILKKVL